MNHTLESITSYMVVVIAGAYSWLVDQSSDILTLGSLVLLGVRLYVDLKKARKVYKGNNDE